ncbi:hypothetical protein ACFTAO_23245 [Paenibacillus rhizoplanae]
MQHSIGAGPGHRIGICARSSFELAAGILGILISGSAYIPLDPAFSRAAAAIHCGPRRAGLHSGRSSCGSRAVRQPSLL